MINIADTLLNTMVPVTAFAVWEILEIWNHSNLFATIRAKLELRTGRLYSLLRCAFCMAPWAALVCVCWFLFGLVLYTYGNPKIGLFVVAPVYALAAARLANMMNDFFYAYTRTPRHDQLPPGIPPEIPDPDKIAKELAQGHIAVATGAVDPASGKPDNMFSVSAGTVKLDLEPFQQV